MSMTLSTAETSQIITALKIATAAAIECATDEQSAKIHAAFNMIVNHPYNSEFATQEQRDAAYMADFVAECQKHGSD